MAPSNCSCGFSWRVQGSESSSQALLGSNYPRGEALKKKEKRSNIIPAVAQYWSWYRPLPVSQSTPSGPGPSTMTGRPSSSRGCWTCRWTQCRASPPSGTTRRASGSEVAAPCRRVCLLHSPKAFVGLSSSTSDRPVVPACCYPVINTRVSNQPVLVCRLFTVACVQTTKACKLIVEMMVAYLILQPVLKSNQSCTSRLYDEDVQDEAFFFIIIYFFYRMSIYNQFVFFF